MTLAVKYMHSGEGGRLRRVNECLKCTIFFSKHSGNARAFSMVRMLISDIGLIKNIIIYAFFFFRKNERSALLSDCAAIIACYIRARRFFNIICLLLFIIYLRFICKAYRKELAWLDAEVASSAK